MRLPWVAIAVLLVAPACGRLGFDVVGASDAADGTVVGDGSCNATTSGLVGWWKLDESSGTRAADSAGVNTGTVTPDATGFWTAGRVNNAGNFDGATQYVDLGSTPLISSTQPFTVAYWAYLDAISTYEIPLTLRTDTTENWRFFWTNFSYDASCGDVTFGSATGWANLDVRLSGSVTGEWHHIAVTYNGSGATTAASFKLYDNGVSLPLSAACSYTNEPGSSKISDPLGGWYWNGKLDDVRIYNRALTDPEISALAGC